MSQGGRVPAGQHELDVGGFPVEEPLEVLPFEEPEIQGDVDLIQDDDPEPAGEHRPEAGLEPAPRPADVLVAGILGDVDETPCGRTAGW